MDSSNSGSGGAASAEADGLNTLLSFTEGSAAFEKHRANHEHFNNYLNPRETRQRDGRGSQQSMSALHEDGPDSAVPLVPKNTADVLAAKQKKKKLQIAFIALSLALGVGSAIIYWVSSKSGAKYIHFFPQNSHVKDTESAVSACVLNALLNGYFFYKWLEDLFLSDSTVAQFSRYDLIDAAEGRAQKIAHVVIALLTTIPFLALAISSPTFNSQWGQAAVYFVTAVAYTAFNYGGIGFIAKYNKRNNKYVWRTIYHQFIERVFSTNQLLPFKGTCGSRVTQPNLEAAIVRDTQSAIQAGIVALNVLARSSQSKQVADVGFQRLRVIQNAGGIKSANDFAEVLEIILAHDKRTQCDIQSRRLARVVSTLFLVTGLVFALFGYAKVSSAEPHKLIAQWGGSDSKGTYAIGLACFIPFFLLATKVVLSVVDKVENAIQLGPRDQFRNASMLSSLFAGAIFFGMAAYLSAATTLKLDGKTMSENAFEYIMTVAGTMTFNAFAGVIMFIDLLGFIANTDCWKNSRFSRYSEDRTDGISVVNKVQAEMTVFAEHSPEAYCMRLMEAHNIKQTLAEKSASNSGFEAAPMGADTASAGGMERGRAGLFKKPDFHEKYSEAALQWRDGYISTMSPSPA